jgi:hypothetical protein
MERQALIDWIKEQPYSGKGFQEDEQGQAALLYRTVDRFCAYLSEVHGIAEIEDTTLEALRGFEFNLPENDDHHLHLVFSYLGRTDLTDYVSMVSADKYFRNKKLTSILKAMDDLKGYAKNLRTAAGIRMASELLEQGATPEGRAQLVEATEVPAEALLQMVQCCDLCRMTGMNGQTLRRSLAMSYDTLAKYRAATPEQIEAEHNVYLQTTGERSNRMVSFSSTRRRRSMSYAELLKETNDEPN